jgi:protein-tyrosine phosphatase
MAEALLRQRMERLGVPATVTSAGLLYDDAQPSQGAVQVLERRGVDLSVHRSRIMLPDKVATADLVLAMARMHLREAVVMAPRRFGRIFTLKEFVRRAERVGPRVEEPFDDWVARVGFGRRTVDFLGESPDDDIADPIGQSVATYDRTAAELEDLVGRLCNLAWSRAAREVRHA